MAEKIDCECGKKVNEVFKCDGCNLTMCFYCQTGERCNECEKYFCNNGNEECGDYVHHRSGHHLVCWNCIMTGLIALRKERAMKAEQ